MLNAPSLNCFVLSRKLSRRLSKLRLKQKLRSFRQTLMLTLLRLLVLLPPKQFANVVLLSAITLI
jgi:hypothetical protein